MPSVFELYGHQLVQEGILSKDEVENKEKSYLDFFKEEHELGKKGDYDMTKGDYYGDFDKISEQDGKTGISEEDFYDFGKKLNTLP